MMLRLKCEVCGEEFYSSWMAKTCLRCMDEARNDIHITSKDAGLVIPPDPHQYARRQIEETIQLVGPIDVDSYYEEGSDEY